MPKIIGKPERITAPRTTPHDGAKIGQTVIVSFGPTVGGNGRAKVTCGIRGRSNPTTLSNITGPARVELTLTEAGDYDITAEPPPGGSTDVEVDIQY